MPIGHLSALFLGLILSANLGAVGKIEAAPTQTKRVEKVIYLPTGSMDDRGTLEANKELVREHINGILINLKDDSGWILLEAKDSKAPYHLREYHPRFRPPYGQIISEFHALGANIYCRVVVFKDVKYPKSKSAGALKDSQTGGLWKNGLGEHWMDPWYVDYHRYLQNIARWGKEAGCKEILLDYVRFPSGGDGDTKNVIYPYFRGERDGRPQAVNSFLESTSKALLGKHNLSAALFGVTFPSGREVGIGQVVPDALRYVKYVAPMLYPSHWDCDSLGLKGDPNLYPYEVYKRALSIGLANLQKQGQTTIVRPFIQVFSIKNIHDGKKYSECTKQGIAVSKVDYGWKEVREQVRAAKEFPEYAGYFLWNPNGRYPKEIF